MWTLLARKDLDAKVHQWRDKLEQVMAGEEVS